MEGQTAWPSSLAASAWVPFFSASCTPVDDARSDLCRRALPLPLRTSPRDWDLGSWELRRSRETRPRSQRTAEETGEGWELADPTQVQRQPHHHPPPFFAVVSFPP